MDDVDGHTETDERLREDGVGNLRQWDHRDGDRCSADKARIAAAESTGKRRAQDEGRS